MKLTLEEAAIAVGGILTGNKDDVVTAVSTDTRHIEKGSLFIALKGEKFDAHDFVSDALEKGSICAVTEKDVEGCHILVDDTRKALGDLARYYLKKTGVPVVAITGSTGKTTTKEIVSSVLSQKYNVHKTDKNYNNDIGVPLTVFGIKPEHQVAVIEMGMNHFGEISYLSSIANPHIALITNIGSSHIENLGSREGILKAKCEIFEHMDPYGVRILNNDDDMLSALDMKAVRYGFDKNNDIWADGIETMGLEGIKCNIHCEKGEFRVTIPVPGRHMVSNAMAATAAGIAMGLEPEQIQKGIEKFSSAPMRMDIIKAAKYNIINDVYNANPVSVKAAMDVLGQAEGAKVCIVGDMLELGSYAPELHKEVGEYGASKGFDMIICIGDISKHTYEGALEKTNKAVYFPTKEDFYKKAPEFVPQGATVLVKASRGMHFEDIVEFLKK